MADELNGEIIPPGASTSMDAPSGLSEASAVFTDGTSSMRTSYAMGFASGAFGMGGGFGAGHGAFSGNLAAARLPQHRDGAMAAAITEEMLSGSPVLTSIIESLCLGALGTGLVLSSKINAAALGITPAQASALSSEIERRFALWAANPVEVDVSGRSTLHQLAHAAYRGYLVKGEVLAVLDVKRIQGARTLTKVALLDATQLDRTRTRSGDGYSTFMGVHFDAGGTITHYWLRQYVPGSQNIDVQPKVVPVRTELGRPKVLHIFDYQAAGQVRGVSPLTSSLASVLEGQQLAEYTLEAARIQTSFAMVIKSAMSPQAALMSVTPADLKEYAARRDEHYKANPVSAKPGMISALAPGDELVMNRSETPNSAYPHFSADLTRTAAVSAGANVEQVSGDYSKANFASSRLATELPHRQNVRRREAILVPFYAGVFSAWLEEQIEGGSLPLPPGAPPFWQARELYTQGRWLGPSRIVADEEKKTKTDILRIANGLTTHADVLAEDGKDLETTYRERAEERALSRKYDLPLIEPGTVTTVYRDNREVPPDAKE